MRSLYIILLFVASESQRVDVPLDTLDVVKDTVQYPVPFGHIFREGFGDPYSDFKQPFDLYELSLRTPVNGQEQDALLKQAPKEKLIKIIKQKMLDRDDFIHEDEEIIRYRAEKKNLTDEVWPQLQSLAEIQLKNVISARTRLRNTKMDKEEAPRRAIADAETERKHSKAAFKNAEFGLNYDLKTEKLNWTTCDEFGNETFFNPKDVVDIDWLPFFVWSTVPKRQALINRFSHPTNKLVKQYYFDFNKFLNKTVDWQQPKLLLTEFTQMLLIAVNKKGLFVGIHEHSIPSSTASESVPLVIPTVHVRLKIVDPYLAMMFCDEPYATIMAVAGDEPTTNKDKIAEAATLGFRGTGRPVWRDLRFEKEMEDMQRREKEMEEKSKFMEINADIP